ncbi:MAG: thioredoxin family protein [Kofleriaceae bacterium]
MRLLSSILLASSLLAAPAFAGDAPKPKAAEAAPAKAEVGKPAPDFSLEGLDGKEFKLSKHKGKVVVLEWFNPGCPYVKKSHTVGSLVDTAKKHTAKGVVWVAINSGAPGREGAELSANTEAVKAFGLTHPVLRDEAGTVGKAYGATNTPHMFVIDKKGVLQYAGAIDNSPDAEKKSAPDGKLVNYVDDAIAAVTAGKPVAVATSKAYGCSVKYAK